MKKMVSKRRREGRFVAIDFGQRERTRSETHRDGELEFVSEASGYLLRVSHGDGPRSGSFAFIEFLL